MVNKKYAYLHKQCTTFHCTWLIALSLESAIKYRSRSSCWTPQMPKEMRLQRVYTSDLLMQTETRNSWGACLKHSKTKCNSFTRRRQAPDDPAIVSIVFYLLVLTRGRFYRSANVVSAGYSKFCLPRSFNALVRSDPLRIYGKALQFLKLESSRQPMVKIW